MYYRDAEVAFLVFDVSSRVRACKSSARSFPVGVKLFPPQKSFDAVKFWLTELKSRASSDIIIAVVANKVDLPSREVAAEVTLNDWWRPRDY